MFEKQNIARTSSKLLVKTGAVALIAAGAYGISQESHNETPVSLPTREAAPRPFESPKEFATKQAEAYMLALNQKTGDNHVPMRILNGELQISDIATGPNHAVGQYPIILSAAIQTGKIEPTNTTLEHSWIGLCSYDKNGEVTITPEEFLTEQGMIYVSHNTETPILDIEAFLAPDKHGAHLVAYDPLLQQTLNEPDGTPLSPGSYINK